MPYARPLMLFLLFTLLVAACAGRPSRPDVIGEAVAPDVAAGTERWSGGALLLPAGSPAVLEARPAQLLDALRRFKSWIVAEPAMLGPDGAQTVQTIEFAWAQVGAYLGVDPLAPSTWSERGIDVTRPLYIGVYPIAEAGTKLITGVDRQIRSELGVPARGDVRVSLRTLVATAGELPEGTNARVLRAVEGLRPVGGLRIVLPMTTSVELLASVRRLAEGAGFEPFPADLAARLDLSPLEGAFWSSGPIPAFAVRVQGSHAIIDVMAPAILGGASSTSDPAADLEQVYEDLRAALQQVPLGRPRAPRAADKPALAISFDQTQAARLVKLRGYQETLQALQLAGAEHRDGLLLGGLLLANDDAANWLLGSAAMPGLAYAVHVGGPEAGEIGRVSMTMFGDAKLPPLGEVPRYPSLGIQDRSAAIGITLEPTRTEAWRSWFASGTSEELASIRTEGVPPLRVVVPGARVLALAFASLGDPSSAADIFPSLATGFGQLQDLPRLEVVGLTPNVADLRLNPKFVVSAILDPDGDASAQAGAVRGEVVAAMRELRDLPRLPGEPFGLPMVVPNVTQTLDVAGLPLLYSRLETSGSVPYLLVGLGLQPGELESEAAVMKTQMSSSKIISARLEPISFLSWLRLDEARPFEPLDLDILAQRLGPLLMEFGGEQVGPASAVSIDVVLRVPPRL